jgi:hypothetical protein
MSNQNVTKVLNAVRENFTALGYSVKESDREFVLHLPHLVSFPSLTRDEQREQIEILTESAIKSSKVPGVTYTLRDTKGLEAGNPNWHQFYVEIHIPKE